MPRDRTERSERMPFIYSGIKKKTDKAGLYIIEGHEFWLPFSQIEDDGDDTVLVPRWLAEEKGL